MVYNHKGLDFAVMGHSAEGQFEKIEGFLFYIVRAYAFLGSCHLFLFKRSKEMNVPHFLVFQVK